MAHPADCLWVLEETTETVDSMLQVDGLGWVRDRVSVLGLSGESLVRCRRWRGWAYSRKIMTWFEPINATENAVGS